MYLFDMRIMLNNDEELVTDEGPLRVGAGENIHEGLVVSFIKSASVWYNFGDELSCLLLLTGECRSS
jgi:hypothetical protein